MHLSILALYGDGHGGWGSGVAVVAPFHDIEGVAGRTGIGVAMGGSRKPLWREHQGVVDGERKGF